MWGFTRRDLTLPTGHMACWHKPESAGKPRLLMGHGNGLTALCQFALMDILGAEFDVHALDFRGHGATRLPTPLIPDDPWGFYENDLKSVIDAHFGGRVRFAGHSLSGAVALRLARWQPDMFQGLVCLDPPFLSMAAHRALTLARHFSPLMRTVRLYRGALKRRDNWVNREEALAYFTGRKALASWPQVAVAAYVETGLIPAPDGGLTLSCDKAWEARTYKFVASELPQSLHKITCPTLIIRADFGSLYKRQLTLWPSTRLINVKGDHFVHIQHPDKIAAHMANFLRNH